MTASDEAGGPETPDEPTAARDGEPNGNGSNVSDQADDEVQIPSAPPVAGDKQLSLAGLGPKRTPIEAEVSLMSAAVPASGLIDPEKEGQLLVSYLPAGYTYVPVREGGKITRWKLRMQLRPTYVMKPEQWPEFAEEMRTFHEEESDRREPALT